VSSNITPLVSVILPTYNRAHCLSFAVTSVLNQYYTNWELIIVDNFSTDNTESLIRNFRDKRIKFFQFSNNGIIAASRNFGLKKATGLYAAFLDSDDWWHEKKLLEYSRFFPSNPSLIYSDLFCISDNLFMRFFYKRIVRSRPLNSPYTTDLFFNTNPIVTSTVLVDLSIFKDVGFFNESPDLVAVEDLDAWIKISRVSSLFFHVPIPLTYYSLSVDGLSRSSLFVKNARCFFNRLFSHHLGFFKYPCWLLYSQSLYYFRLSSYKRSFLFSRYALLSYFRYRASLKYSFLFLLKLVFLFLVSLLFVCVLSFF